MESAERQAVMAQLPARMAEAGLVLLEDGRPLEGRLTAHLRRGAAVSRILLVLAVLAATAGAVVAYGDPEPDRARRATPSRDLSAQAGQRASARAVQISARAERRIRAASQDQRRHRADGDRYRRDFGGADL